MAKELRIIKAKLSSEHHTLCKGHGNAVIITWKRRLTTFPSMMLWREQTMGYFWSMPFMLRRYDVIRLETSGTMAETLAPSYTYQLLESTKIRCVSIY